MSSDTASSEALRELVERPGPVRVSAGGEDVEFDQTYEKALATPEGAVLVRPDADSHPEVIMLTPARSGVELYVLGNGYVSTFIGNVNFIEPGE